MGDAGNLVSASTVKSSSQGTETIWKAAAYGELSAVQGFIAEEKALVYKADEQGFHPLQWAALNNRTDVVTCLLGEGAQVNAVDHTGQTALHWAAVRGSLSAAEALLRSSADIQIRDCRGYTVAHVASQYGQTALLYHLALRWEVDVEGGDNDGRTCLQWAAYKGFADTIRLLLVLDAHVEHADKEGCTALHWAAIRGNGEACTILMQAGAASLLTTKDITGCTPAELASEKGHRFLANYLRDYKEKEDGHQRLCGKAGALSWLTSTQLCPIIWLIIVSLVALFIHKVVQNSSFPELGGLTTSMAWACVTCASAGLVLLYRITVADPGFLPRSTGSSSAARSSALSKASPSKALKQPLDQLLGRKKLESSNRDSEDSSERLTEYRQLDSPALWAGNWTQLCVSCKIVRPLRAKHCSVTDRCVEQFDHYCPWKGCVAWNIYYIYFKLLKLVMICYLYLLMAIGGSPLFSHYLASWKMAGKHVKFTHEVGNTIGKGNRFKFLAFLIIETVAMSCGLAVAILRIHQASKAKKPSQGIPWIFLFIFGDGFLLIGVTALMVTQASQIARNITTNELANWPRYKYLRKADGAFFNPFDRGCRENCIETAYPSQHPTAPAVLEDSILESAPLMQEAACRSGCKHYN